jgi:hypothetical protein
MSKSLLTFALAATLMLASSSASAPPKALPKPPPAKGKNKVVVAVDNPIGLASGMEAHHNKVLDVPVDFYYTVPAKNIVGQDIKPMPKGTVVQLHMEQKPGSGRYVKVAEARATGKSRKLQIKWKVPGNLPLGKYRYVLTFPGNGQFETAKSGANHVQVVK